MASKLLGPYEFYYSAGYLYRICAISRPLELPGYFEIIDELKKRDVPKDDGAAYLYREVLSFSGDGQDDETKIEILSDLFADGYSDGAVHHGQ